MTNPNRRSPFTKATTYIDLDHIPGPRGLYYFEFVRHFQKNILEAFTRVNDEYESIASFPWPMNSIIIYSPDYVKNVLVENSKSYIKGEQIEELRAIVGNGLATNNNHETWLKSRALLAKEFNNKSVTGFIQDFENIAAEQFENYPKDDFQIDFCQEMKHLTFKIASRTLLGRDLSKEDADTVNDAVHFTSMVTYKRIFQVFPLPYWLPTLTNFKFKYHFNNLNNIVVKLITDEKQNSRTIHKGVLQKLVHAKDEETNYSFSDDELRDEVLTMMIAGHETSAHTLTWTFGLLAKHPDIQEKLFLEIQKHENCDPINYLDENKYLKCVLFESMRLYPAFPVLSRKASTDLKLGDYDIPKNTNVVIPIYVMQRNENNWKNAKEFNPDRFLDESAEKSYAFLPFSRGPRRCIAELFANTEAAIIVVELLKRYKISLIDNHFPKEEALVSLKPIGGMPLKFTKRS
jgi:cytochrome P450